MFQINVHENVIVIEKANAGDEEYVEMCDLLQTIGHADSVDWFEARELRLTLATVLQHKVNQRIR